MNAKVLGTVAEAAQLVAPRNIRIIHALPGVDAAFPTASGVAAAAAEFFDSTGGGVSAAGTVAGGTGNGRVSGGGRNIGGGMTGTGATATASPQEQVPIFRYEGCLAWSTIVTMFMSSRPDSFCC